jgi:hypothetical protein
VRLFNQDAKVQALKRALLFEGLSRKELVLLARVTEDLELPAGEVASVGRLGCNPRPQFTEAMRNTAWLDLVSLR